MGIETAVIIGAAATALGAGLQTYTALTAEDPKSAADIRKKADKKAREQRQRIAMQMATKGQTVLSSPAGSGMTTKGNLS